MRLIHGHGFPSDVERDHFREVIITNIVESMERLVHSALALDIPLENSANQESFENVNNIEKTRDCVRVWESETMRSDFKKLFSDPGIQKTLARRNEFHLDDSAEYFLKDLERISQPSYIPTNRDVLMSRKKTTGIVESDFDIFEQKIKLVDVGGQRNERKKWIHCFEGVNALLFVVSLSEFDQVCYEDNNTNRMHESLLLFEEVCANRFFNKTHIILYVLIRQLTK
jgi:hypothetical protein